MDEDERKQTSQQDRAFRLACEAGGGNLVEDEDGMTCEPRTSIQVQSWVAMRERWKGEADR